MTLTNLRSTQINTVDIGTTSFASSSQVSNIQSNLDSFVTYANSSFSASPSFTAGMLLPESIKTTDVNANATYASSNIVSISTAVSSGDNLLVYLDGLLQHPDTYVLRGDSIQFANVEPLPANVSVGVRHLATPSTLIANTGSANQLTSSNGSLLWDYENKRIYVYDGVTEGGFYANATQTFGYSFQGTVSGYTSGGAATATNAIDKFPFASNGNATDVGDLTVSRAGTASQSSSTFGYASGGPASNVIDKFPFAADANATDVGDLTVGRYGAAGQSSDVSGYSSGGTDPGLSNVIDKFPFSTDSNATDVGNLTQSRREPDGQSSEVSGYSSGGGVAPATNTIDKFPFAADANATDVGDLTQGRYGAAGQSSDVSGYSSGGGAPGDSNVIDKFPFASNANATDVGDLTQARKQLAGQSSVDSGYSAGATFINIIDKFPFASNANATDVGDLTIGRRSASGQQV